VEYILSFLAIITLAIFFHELGHYLVARFYGIAIETFSIGFGKELFGFTTKTGTRWRISLIPLGGYVQMFGHVENENEPVPSHLSGDSLKHKSTLVKLQVYLAGPLFSFLLAIPLHFVIVAQVGEYIIAPVAGEIIPGSPSEKAGMLSGDRIIAINGRHIEKTEEMSIQIATSGGDPLAVDILRSGEKKTLYLQAFPNKDGLFQIGVAWSLEKENIIHRIYSTPGALKRSVTITWEQTKFYVESLKILKTRESLKTLAGPVGIGKIAGDMYSSGGVIALVSFLALLTIALGVFNLFPILPLDGGWVLVSCIEGVTGKRLDKKIIYWLSLFGWAFLLVLVFLATGNDIARIFQ